MMTMKTCLKAFACLALFLTAAAYGKDTAAKRDDALRLLTKDGLYRKAYDAYAELLDTVDDDKSGDDLVHLATASLKLSALSPEQEDMGNLTLDLDETGAAKTAGPPPEGTWLSVDDLVTHYARKHSSNPHYFLGAARAYRQVPHRYTVKNGRNVRTNRYDGTRCEDRDTLCMLHYYKQAWDLADKRRDGTFLADLLPEFVRGLSFGITPPFRLQAKDHAQLAHLTELSIPGQWDVTRFPSDGNDRGDGRKDMPVFYDVPDSWAQSKNDGERIQSLFNQLIERYPSEKEKALLTKADWVSLFFSVKSLLNNRFPAYGNGPGIRTKTVIESHSLKDNQTIWMIDEEPDVITLPEGYDFMAIYERLVKADDTGVGAGIALFNERLARGQYRQAAGLLQKLLEYRKKPEPYREDDDSVEALQWRYLDKARQALLEPNCTFPMNDAEERSPGRAEVRIPFAYRNAGSVVLSVRELDLERLFRHDARLLGKRKNLLLPSLSGWYGELDEKTAFLDRFSSYLKKDSLEFVVPLKASPPYEQQNTTLKLPLEKPGVYYVTATLDNGYRIGRLVTIDDVGAVARDGYKGLYIHVTDENTGLPLPGMSIDAVLVDDQGNISSIKGETNEQGTLLILPRTKQFNHVGMLARISGNGKTLYSNFSRYYLRGRESDAGRILYMVDSQPAYRPGQTVHLKGYVLKKHLQASTAAFAGQTYPIALYDPSGDKVPMEQATVTTNDFSAFELEFQLPSDARLGAWRVSIDGNGKGWEQSSHSFRVEEYKKQEFDIAVVPPSKPVPLHQDIEFRIKGSYLAGGGLKRGKAGIKVVRNPMTEFWAPPTPGDWLSLTNNRNTSPKTDNPWGVDIIEQEIEFDLPPGQDDLVVRIPADKAYALLKIDSNQQFDITATVTDDSLRQATARGSVRAMNTPFEISIASSRQFGRTGRPLEFTLTTADIAGNIVPGRQLDAVLYAEATDDSGRRSTKAVHSWTAEETVTSADGTAAVSWTPASPGDFVLKVSAAGGNGKTVSSEYKFQVYGDNIPGSSSSELRSGFVPDKVAYMPGDRAAILVRMDIPDRHIMIVTRPGRKNEEIHFVDIRNGYGLLEIDLTGEDAPGIYLEAPSLNTAFRPDRMICRLNVLPPNKTLDLVVRTDRPTYKPGEQGIITVDVRDRDGKPLPARTELAVTVYDQSLDLMFPSYSPSLVSTLWSDDSYFGGTFKNRLLIASASLYMPDGQSPMVTEGAWNTLWGSSPPPTLSINSWLYDTPRDSIDGLATGGVRSVPAADPFGEPAQVPVMVMESADMSGDPFGGETAKQSGTTQSGTLAPFIQPRRNFVDLIKWSGSLVTDAGGRVNIPVSMPDNLSTWTVKVWALSREMHAGYGEAQFMLTQDFLVSLQAPRFFVEGDTVMISGLVRNLTDNEIKAEVRLQLPEDRMLLLPESKQTRSCIIPAKGQTRVDWMVKAIAEGNAEIVLSATGDDARDAMVAKYPVLVRGAELLQSRSTTILPDRQQAELTVSIPEERAPGSTSLTVSLSPSMAATVVEALPFMAEYPHGCVEQTLNKFLPMVLVRQTMKANGIDLGTLKTGYDPARHPRMDRNPVFDEAELSRMVEYGVKRLRDMMNENGSWSWFPGMDSDGDPVMTALVYRGLKLAQQAGVEVLDNRRMEQAKRWLVSREETRLGELRDKREKKQPGIEDAYLRFTLSEQGVSNPGMLSALLEHRHELPLYGKILLAHTCHLEKNGQALTQLLEHLKQYEIHDAATATVSIRRPIPGYWWFWYEQDVSLQAAYLRLMNAVEPHGETTAGLARWLANNRVNGTYWHSTKDSAEAIEALCGFMTSTQEASTPVDVEVSIDGKSLGSCRLDVKTMFADDIRFNVPDILLTTTTTEPHTILIKRTGGNGTVYANTVLRYVSKQDPIPAAGNELQVKRTYYLVGKDGRSALKPGDALKSGDLIESELIIRAKNDYEYILIDDPKPAGCESTDTASGYRWLNGFGAYKEIRDESIRFYSSAIPMGEHVITHRMRAERPGRFSALPAALEPMYVPDIRGNSAEDKISIREK